MGDISWLFEPRDWASVESWFSRSLPRDYKALVDDGIACVFDEELTLLSPFDPDPTCNLVAAGAAVIDGIAFLRSQGWSEYAVPIHPEVGGLIAWGIDPGGGGRYLWDTAAADPDNWTVVIEGRPVDPQMQRHPLGLVDYLDAVRRGAIKAAALSGWPDANARFERRPLK